MSNATSASGTPDNTGKPAARPDSGKTITLEILRYIPGQHDKPEFQPFQIPYVEDWSMLDALAYIKDELDSSLA